MSSIHLQRRPHAARARRTPTIRIHKQPLHIIHELSGDEDEAVPRFCIAENEEQALRAPSPAFTMMTSSSGAGEGKTKMDRRQASIVPIWRSSLEEECTTTLQVPRRTRDGEDAASPDSFNITFSDKPFDFPRPPLPTPSSAKYSPASFPSSPSSSSSSSYSSSDSESDSHLEEENTRTDIEPLRIVKRRRSLSRAVSRAPLPHSPSSIVVVSDPSEDEAQDSESDDIGFYASQFNKILTLSSPLPSSFPSSSTSRPETLYVPAGGSPMPSPQLDPAFAQMNYSAVKRSSLAPVRHSRPPPTPPSVIISPCPSPRPPPRSSLPTDFELTMDMDDFELEWEGDDSMEIIELIEEDEFSSDRLSPYPGSFIPQDVDVDEDEYSDYDDEEEVGSLRHFVLPVTPSVSGDLTEELKAFAEPAFPSSPSSADSLCVPMGDARLVEPISAHSLQAEFFEVPFTQDPSTSSCSSGDHYSSNSQDEVDRDEEERDRVLRSRWSSSTLSSIHSTHHHHQKHNSHSSGLFLLSPLKSYFTSRKSTSTSPPSSPSKRSSSPSKMFPSLTREKSEKKTAHLPPALVLPSPTRPARPYAYRSRGVESPASAWSFPSTPGSSPSPSPRKPRRSESSACGSEASYTSSSTSSSSGSRMGGRRMSGRRSAMSGRRSEASFRSERSVGSAESVISCGSVMSEGGLRRKPIPVEMFLRA